MSKIKKIKKTPSEKCKMSEYERIVNIGVKDAHKQYLKCSICSKLCSYSSIKH